MDDLVQRLRAGTMTTLHSAESVMHEAADEIERLRAENGHTDEQMCDYADARVAAAVLTERERVLEFVADHQLYPSDPAHELLNPAMHKIMEFVDSGKPLPWFKPPAVKGE